MPPMTTRTADADGFVTDDTVNYYMARVRGGVGLITCEMASPERAGRHRRHELGIYDDRFLPGLRRLTAAIHGGGAKASIQLGHAGGHTRRDICGETPIAPSAIPHPVYEITDETIMPEAMTQARIAETIAAFAAAARGRARRDSIASRFMPRTAISSRNSTPPSRTAAPTTMAAALENRARFGLEVLRAVKAAVPGMPVIYRLSVEDYFPGGMPYAEGRQIARWAAAARAPMRSTSPPAITARCRRRRCSSRRWRCRMRPGSNIAGRDQAPRCAIPVIAVGRLGDPGASPTRRSPAARPISSRLGRSLRGGSRMGRRSSRAASRRGAALPATPASTRCAAAPASAASSTARRASETQFLAAAPVAGRAHRRHRRRSGRAELCRARRRRQQRHRVRARRPRRRRLPLCRQGAAVPGGRGQSAFLRALYRVSSSPRANRRA